MKICGLTRLEDVLLARDLGAWALGFVFAPSPRRLAPAAARRLITGLKSVAMSEEPALSREAAVTDAPGHRLPLAIGVFGDISAEEVAAIVREAELDGAQLHGLAGPRADEVRARVGRCSRPFVIIKAVPVASDATSAGLLRAAVAAAEEDADVALLDTKSAGRFGGSGTPFPWRLAREAVEGVPVLVAGGIGPENVRTALDAAGAWGVDVSSGVERSPGVKDAELLTRLFAQVGVAQRAGSPNLGSATTSAGQGLGPVDGRQEGTDR